MRKLIIGLGCLALVGCSTESSDVSDLDAHLTNDGVYGTFVTADVVIDFASVADGAGGFDVTIEPTILDPDRLPKPTQAGNLITTVEERPEDREPPRDQGNGSDAFDDFLFAVDTQLPADHPAVDALRTAAEQL